MTTTTAAPPGLRLENRHTGEILEIRRLRRNGEIAFELRGTLPARREGPPMHIHHFEDEEGSVTSGTLSAILDGKQVKVRVGETALLPHGVPHRWWNAEDEPLAFHGIIRPAVDLDRYLQAVFEVVNAGTPDRPPLFYLAHVAVRHRQTQTVLVMPQAIQSLFFRAVVAVGTLLGRYRGTEWPGCPSRCTGAPEPMEGNS